MPGFGIDQLREATVKILGPDGKTVAGSGFIIRSDGYLITCHHVIYQLDQLRVEYQGKIYEAEWCEDYSNPEVDLAILKSDLTDARPVPIINPRELSGSVNVYGFPRAQDRYFPEGYDVHAANIHPGSPLLVLPTFPTTKLTICNRPWHRLPQENSSFLTHRLDQRVESGCSGGPVFSKELRGVVGVIQGSKSAVSYAIRWDNIQDILDQLGLEPEKNAVCAFLQDVEDLFQYMPLFHVQQQVVIEDQYIPIQVTLERRYKHEVETSWGYAESEEELKRAYALKGWGEEEQLRQVPWEPARQDHNRIMVLADPGMGKSTLLRLEARRTAQAGREQLAQGKATIGDVVLPIFLRLSELQKEEKEIARSFCGAS
jgi:hypothetical protein